MAQKPLANDDPSFESTTIKLSKPGIQGNRILLNDLEFSTINTSLSDLITFAYGIQKRQITGGPDWLEGDKFDLVAEPDTDGQPSDAQLKRMMQKLLADRFKLSFHRDKKELPLYAIVVGRIGPKLVASASDPNGSPSLFFRQLGVLPAWNATIADLAGVMQTAVLDRPVVDRTGMSGRYDFTLTWTPDKSQFGGRAVRALSKSGDAMAPDLFTAFQEQLGLKLESTIAPIDVIVIDGVERPDLDALF